MKPIKVMERFSNNIAGFHCKPCQGIFQYFGLPQKSKWGHKPPSYLSHSDSAALGRKAQTFEAWRVCEMLAVGLITLLTSLRIFLCVLAEFFVQPSIVALVHVTSKKFRHPLRGGFIWKFILTEKRCDLTTEVSPPSIGFLSVNKVSDEKMFPFKCTSNLVAMTYGFAIRFESVAVIFKVSCLCHRTAFVVVGCCLRMPPFGRGFIFL